jgi:hypothetical protein
MKQIIYNAPIIRFRPYRDLGEFVNIGVLVYFPQINQNFLKISNDFSRIKGFFPEIKKELFDEILSFLTTEMTEYQPIDVSLNATGQLFCDMTSTDSLGNFRQLTSIKEGVIYFGEIISGITENAPIEVDELYNYYVMRNSTKPKLDNEEMLKETFLKQLNNWKLASHFSQGFIGNENYRIPVPFVNPKLSIKTLFLDRSAIEIYNTGDQLISKLSRLSTLGDFDKKLLLPILYSNRDDAKIKQASNDITLSLEKFKFVKVLPIIAQSRIFNYIIQNI